MSFCVHGPIPALHIAGCKLQTARRLLVTAAIFVAAACSTSVTAEDRQPSSIDDELLEDLGADPIDDFDRELFDRDRRRRGGEGLLGEAAAAEDENPLLSVARRMREVERQIGRHESKQSTQAVQKQIVADLDALIRQARKACKKCGPGGNQPPGVRPRRRIGPPGSKSGAGDGKSGDGSATAGTRRSPGRGDARKVDMGQMRQLIKRLWGELPPSQREQMLQLPIEEFLPKYEWLTEEYFRRLSQEKKPGE